jgi:hypothetical protein
MDYIEQLANPIWQKKRLKILERDNWECTFCGDGSTTLHVHHKKYDLDKKAWEYPDNTFISLCKHCHKILEYLKKEKISEEPISVIKYESDSNYILVAWIVKFINKEKNRIIFIKYFTDSGHIEYSMAITSFVVSDLQKELEKISKKDGESLP